MKLKEREDMLKYFQLHRSTTELKSRLRVLQTQYESFIASEEDSLQKEKSKLESDLWQEISEDDIEDQVAFWKELNGFFSKMTLSEKDVKKYSEELKAFDTEKLSALENLLLGYKESIDVKECPVCSSALMHDRDRETLIPFDKEKFCKVPTEYKNKAHLESKILEVQKQLKKVEKLKELLDQAQTLYQNAKDKIAGIITENNLEISESDIPQSFTDIMDYFQTNKALAMDLQKLQAKDPKSSSTALKMKASIKELEQKISQASSASNLTIDFSVYNEVQEQTIIKDQTILFQLMLRHNNDLSSIDSKIKAVESEIKRIQNFDRTESQIETEIEENRSSLKEQHSNLEKADEMMKKFRSYQEAKIQLDKYKKAETQLLEVEEREKFLRQKYEASLILKEKILKAEGMALSSLIESLNLSVQLYLEHFFIENPIQVEVKAFNEDGKPQINLEINYKGVEHDLSMLSGGEMSRLVLAFTLALAELQSSPLILLDECTASLDQDLSTQVVDGLKEHFSDRLVILIAHQVVQGAFDKIIRVDLK